MARRFQRLAVVLAFLATATVLLAGWALREKGRVFSRDLVRQAKEKLEVDPQLSVSLARKGATWSWEVWPVPEASDALRQALFESHLRLNLTNHTGKVNRAVFSPDGAHIVTASADRSARVWHLPLASGTLEQWRAIVERSSPYIFANGVLLLRTPSEPPEPRHNTTQPSAAPRHDTTQPSVRPRT